MEQKASKTLYRIVKPSELQQLYFPYHSLDPAQVIERILEAKGMDNDDMVKRGGGRDLKKASKRREQIKVMRKI